MIVYLCIEKLKLISPKNWYWSTLDKLEFTASIKDKNQENQRLICNVPQGALICYSTPVEVSSGSILDPTPVSRLTRSVEIWSYKVKQFWEKTVLCTFPMNSKSSLLASPLAATAATVTLTSSALTPEKLRSSIVSINYVLLNFLKYK